MKWTLDKALERLEDVCEGRYSETHNMVVQGTDDLGQRMVLLEQAQAAEAQKWSALVVALAAAGEDFEAPDGLRVFTNEASTLLIHAWPSGAVTMRAREDPDAIWGPPITMIEEKA